MGGSSSQSSLPPHKIRELNEVTYRSLSEGDLVKFPRRFITHWGVYIGEDDLVVNLTADTNTVAGECEICKCSFNDKQTADFIATLSGDKNRSTVCQICKKPYISKARIFTQNIRDVAGTSIVKKANDYDKEQTPLGPKDIVKRAKEKAGPANYNWFMMNCEHFATWCRYNIPKSSQSMVFWRKPGDFEKALKQNVM